MQCTTSPLSATTLSRHLPKSPPQGRGQADQATLVEIFADSVVDGGATGFALGQIAGTQIGSGKPLLWIQDRVTRREAGRPCLAGLQTGGDIIHVNVNKTTDALWAMEEGLRCGDLCGVIGEIWGDPPALDFTATKRLALRAEANTIPAWLMRRATAPNLSAARDRWRIKSLASLAHPHDNRAPGRAQWQADLFRSRRQTPGQWVVHHDTSTGLHFSHQTAAQSTKDTALQA